MRKIDENVREKGPDDFAPRNKTDDLVSNWIVHGASTIKRLKNLRTAENIKFGKRC